MDPRFVRPQHNAGMYPIRIAHTQHSDTYGEYIRDEHTWSGLVWPRPPRSHPLQKHTIHNKAIATILKIRDPFRNGKWPTLRSLPKYTNTTASQLTGKVYIYPNNNKITLMLCARNWSTMSHTEWNVGYVARCGPTIAIWHHTQCTNQWVETDFPRLPKSLAFTWLSLHGTHIRSSSIRTHHAPA